MTFSDDNIPFNGIVTNTVTNQSVCDDRSVFNLARSPSTSVRTGLISYCLQYDTRIVFDS